MYLFHKHHFFISYCSKANEVTCSVIYNYIKMAMIKALKPQKCGNDEDESIMSDY